MYNCIYTAHCTELVCDKSCPTLVETSYLLERNGIAENSFVYSTSTVETDSISDKLDEADNLFKVFVVSSASKYSTVQYAELVTYCAICKNWKGNRLHCNVYNLKFSKYIEMLKASWNSVKSDPEELQYIKIWSESAKVLIVSNLDYVNFGDFECQTLLNLIQSRSTGNLTTILISPQLNSLVSSKQSNFFGKLIDMMRKEVIKL